MNKDICQACHEPMNEIHFKFGCKKLSYVFTREVKAWGVEAGDCYNEQIHLYQGGTEKLLAEGVIEVEPHEANLPVKMCEDCSEQHPEKDCPALEVLPVKECPYECYKNFGDDKCHHPVKSDPLDELVR